MNYKPPYLYSDIDFLDDYDWSNNEDQYQLVYGILYDSVHNNTELNIYNRLVKLIEQYEKTPALRIVKIKFWIDTIVNVKNALEECIGENKHANPLFSFPFFGYVYNSTIEDYEVARDYTRNVRFNTLVKNFNFAKSILETFEENEKLELAIYNTSNFEYPIESLYIYLNILANDYFNKSKEYEDYYAYGCGVLWEIFRRGIWNDEDSIPPIIYDTHYHRYLLNYSDDDIERLSKGCNNKQKYKNKDETSEDSHKNKTIKEITGVLLHMLQSFGIKDKEQIRKVVHYVASPHKEYQAKASPYDTIYTYLHDESKLLNVYEKVKVILQKYDIRV